MEQRTVLAVVIKDGKVLAFASNDHKEPCKRIGYPNGVGYELCEGCQNDNHAEYKAVQHIEAGADLYLFGHDHACESCKAAMDNAGIRKLHIINQ